MKISLYSILLILLPSFLIGQIENSPYSAFGFGDKKYEGPASSVSMGGLGNVFWDNVHVNPNNPASYTFLTLTNFSLGAQGQVATLETDAKSEEVNEVGISHLIMGIPMGKWGGLAFGFLPTSSTGYEINSEEQFIDKGSIITEGLGYDGSYTQYTYFKGNGAINRFFIGGSFSPLKGLSVGLNVMYDFGNLTRSTVSAIPPVYKVLELGKPAALVYEGDMYGSKEEISIKLRDWNYQFGLMYTGILSEKLQYTVGGTFGIENETELDVSRYMYTIKYSPRGAIIPVDTLYSVSGVKDLRDVTLPTNGGFGASVGNYKKWMIGVNYEYKDPLSGLDNVYDGVVHTKQQQYSIGGYFIPKYNSLMSYTDRITYRAGFKYAYDGLRIDGIDIVDYSVSFGLGLPMSNGASNVNVGGRFGSRGTTDMGLIREKYFSFVVSFSLSDKWFKKVKYN